MHQQFCEIIPFCMVQKFAIFPRMLV